MKIAIYSPYLDTAGGGEKYILTIAEYLSGKEEVFVLLDHHLQSLDLKKIIDHNQKLHNLDLSRIKFIPAPIGQSGQTIKRFRFLQQFDFFFYLTDGSIFASGARNNIVHFQVPFTNTSATGILGQLKLAWWQKAIYNSLFTKQIVEKTWPLKGEVVYPPVNTESFKPLAKKKQLLSIGRFYGYDKSKKQQFLIESFQELSKSKKTQGWSLHLVGGLGEGDDDYLNSLKKIAKGSKIHFYPNLSFAELVKLTGSSSIYWHAKGYLETDPVNFEHFGITTVEAMAAGCVPVVINKGGQPEIVDDGQSGYLWHDQSGLIEKTLKLISDPILLTEMSKKSEQRAKRFSKINFEQAINRIVYG